MEHILPRPWQKRDGAFPARNTGSRRVLEKAGFTLEGVLRQSVCKDGEILDSCLYALVKEEVS